MSGYFDLKKVQERIGGERFKRIAEAADRHSAEIRLAEEFLRENHVFADAWSDKLKWDATKRRIMFGDRPLIEQPIRERLENMKSLTGLCIRAVENTEKALGIVL